MNPMALEHGRPADLRAPREMVAYDTLDRLHISYRRVDHAPADTMEACAAVDEILGVRMCKNLFLCNRQCTDFYLLLMPGDKPFRTKELSAQLNVSRLSFGSSEHMEPLLGLSPGSVSVLGLINDTAHRVRLLIDKDLLTFPEIGCHPLVNTSSVAFSIEDLLHTLLPSIGHSPTVVELSHGENEANAR